MPKKTNQKTKGRDAVRAGLKDLEQSLELRDIDIQIARFDIEGKTRLVMNRLAHEGQIASLEKRAAGKAKPKERVRNPKEEYERGMYRISKNKLGFPAQAFKRAMHDAVRRVEGLTLVESAGGFKVIPDDPVRDLVEIKGKPQMRTDVVRIGSKGSNTGVPDIRYRPEVFPWSARISVEYDRSMMSPDLLMHLLNLAGFHYGVGEWRPQKAGSWGQFKIVGSK